MKDQFSTDWLRTREPFDAAARSRPLAQSLASVLPKRPHILDLGAGTGSMFRFLAPIIARPQVWTFLEKDESLLGEALALTAEWGAAHGWTITWPKRALVLHTPSGAWRIEGSVQDFGAALPRLDGADAVVCSALLDLVSATWLNRLASALRTPFLACMTIDGQGKWLPPHPLDRIARSGFQLDQGRDKGFGPALGARAAPAARLILERHGFTVRSAPTEWRISRRSPKMLTTMMEMDAMAAQAARPSQRTALREWRSRRFEQIALGRASLRVGHRDLLALPPAASPASNAPRHPRAKVA